MLVLRLEGCYWWYLR